MPQVPDRRFDLSIAVHDWGDGRPSTEDPALTDFLRRAIDEALSLSEDPPPCPNCRSRRTFLSRRPTGRRRAPEFGCRDCEKGFRRMTGTALWKLSQSEIDKLPAFVALLSQQLPSKAAVLGVGVNRSTARKWVARFRQWLLALDPSGYWEAKVRLGIKPPDPVATCPACSHHGPIKLHGFDYGRGRSRAERIRMVQCRQCQRYFSLRGEQLQTILKAGDAAKAYH